MSSLSADLPLIPIKEPKGLRAYSEPVPCGDFPRAVNWTNPRVAAILDAAAQCFSSRGFTATTLADIGKELGLRKSIVHYYFKSKATLVEEVQSFAYNRYIELIGSALGKAQGNEQLAGPVSEPPASAARAIGSRDRLSAGIKQLWTELNHQGAIRGLSIELWSEGRRNDELLARSQTLESEAHRLLRNFIEANRSGSLSTDIDADDLATLTLALIDGLIVREERDGPNQKNTKAFETFLKLLK